MAETVIQENIMITVTMVENEEMTIDEVLHPKKMATLYYEDVAWDDLLCSIAMQLSTLGYIIKPKWQEDLVDAIQGVADKKMKGKFNER